MLPNQLIKTPLATKSPSTKTPSVTAVLLPRLQGVCRAFLVSPAPALDGAPHLPDCLELSTCLSSLAQFLEIALCILVYSYSQELYILSQSLFIFPQPNSDWLFDPWKLYHLELCPKSYCYHFKSCSSFECMCVYICVYILFFLFFLRPINLFVKCNLLRALVSRNTCISL